MILINIGDKIKSTGSTFTILTKKSINYTGKVLTITLSEQRINEDKKSVAYEVAIIKTKKAARFVNGKWITINELMEYYPSAESFGKDNYDISRNLPLRFKKHMEDYFNALPDTFLRIPL